MEDPPDDQESRNRDRRIEASEIDQEIGFGSNATPGQAIEHTRSIDDRER